MGVFAKRYKLTHYNASKVTSLLPCPDCCSIWYYCFAFLFLYCAKIVKLIPFLQTLKKKF